MGAWYLLTVRFLKTNSGKKGEGMPVVRNPQFYFREGFCWNNVLTTYMKCKKKEKTVQSTESMSFFSCTEQTPEYYLISIMNSRFAAFYVDNLVNSTSHCTTGDAKLIDFRLYLLYHKAHSMVWLFLYRSLFRHPSKNPHLLFRNHPQSYKDNLDRKCHDHIAL